MLTRVFLLGQRPSRPFRSTMTQAPGRPKNRANPFDLRVMVLQKPVSVWSQVEVHMLHKGQKCTVSMYIYVYLCISMYIYVYLCISMYIYVYLCISMYIYVYLCISMYIYVYLCISIGISMYIYVYQSTSTVLKSHQAGKVTASPWHGGDTEKSHQKGKSHQGRRITMAQPVSSIMMHMPKSGRSIAHNRENGIYPYHLLRLKSYWYSDHVAYKII